MILGFLDILDEGVRLGVIPKLDPILVHMHEGPGELLELGVGTNSEA